MGMQLTEKGLVKIVAIVCITAIEIANLLTLGIDSAFGAAVIGAIAGIAGYAVGRARA
jgi:hypothetical protein